jgi:hypothetical protein
MRRLLPWLLVGALALAAGGCGQATHEVTATDVRNYELEEIRDMYKLYAEDKHRPPTQLAQLKQYEPGFSKGFEALQSGEVVVVWGADLSETAGKGVLAYGKDVPTKGGPVLLRDGTIKIMTAQEFQAAAPKSKS